MPALTWSIAPNANQTAGLSSPTPVLQGVACTPGGAEITAYSDNLCLNAIAGTPLTGNTAAGPDGAGKLNFAAFVFTTVTTYYLKGTGANYTASACAGPYAVAPGVPASLHFTVQPSATATVNIALAPQPKVTVKDAYANIVTTDNATAVGLTAYTDVGCATPASYGTLTFASATASSGIATFAGFKGSAIGTYYFKASSGALTTDCSSSVAFSAGAPGNIASCSGLSGYTVITGSTQASGGNVCAANEILLYGMVNNNPIPMCVDLDCGADSVICKAENNSSGGGQNVQHYCAYP